MEPMSREELMEMLEGKWLLDWRFRLDNVEELVEEMILEGAGLDWIEEKLGELVNDEIFEKVLEKINKEI